jgi:hypothetical protein
MSLFSKLLAIACIGLFSFCHKDSDFQSEGKILGIDGRKCACFGEKCGCCGAWLISIDEKSYLFTELPSKPKLTLDGNTPFPIQIRLDWKFEKDSCAKAWNYIQIERFELD